MTTGFSTDIPNPHAAPALDTKEARTAMTKCLNALDDLTDDQRARVIRALAALFGVGA